MYTYILVGYVSQHTGDEEGAYYLYICFKTLDFVYILCQSTLSSRNNFVIEEPTTLHYDSLKQDPPPGKDFMCPNCSRFDIFMLTIYDDSFMLNNKPEKNKHIL